MQSGILSAFAVGCMVLPGIVASPGIYIRIYYLNIVKMTKESEQYI